MTLRTGRLYGNVSTLATLWLALAGMVHAQSLIVTLSSNAVEGIATRPDLRAAALAQAPVTLHLQIAGGSGATASVTLSAEDIFAKPVSWSATESLPLDADGKAVRDIPFRAPGPGYYLVRAAVKAGPATAEATTDFGIVAPPYPGLRPESFFASNTSQFKRGPDLDLLEAIGMKVERLQFYPKMLKEPSSVPSGQAVPMDFTGIDKLWAEAKAHGQWMLPILGYSFPGDSTPLAKDLGMYGPPADNGRFAATWAAIMAHYPEVTAVEFWNEAWIYGWTWAGTPADYRATQKALCEALLKVNPRMRIVAGSSTPFIVDDFEPEPESWKGLLAGISQHPYSVAVNDPNLRAGDQFRMLDETPLVARRMGLPYAYVTEGGTWYSAAQKKIDALNAEAAAMTPDQKASDHGRAVQAELAFYRKDQGQFNNLENASKIVQYFVESAIDGLYQGDAQWQIGYGAGWTRGNTTFAVMTHFLEDRPIVADIWPSNELLWGGVFANPKFVTAAVKALPRANELSARWVVDVPKERAADKTKVAVLWSLTGKSNTELDTAATISLSSAPDLKAYDMTGRQIPAVDGRLTLPFTTAPVYVTSDALSVVELRQRVRSGAIRQATPVNLYALSLSDDPAKPQQLSVRVENQMNLRVEGTLRLKVKASGAETSVPFSIPAAKLVEVKVPWKGTDVSPSNQYGVTLTAETSAGTLSRDQVIGEAAFVQRTIPIDGDMAAWKGITPVLIDSDLLASDANLAQYMANPGLEQPTGSAAKKRIVARVYTAYDAENVYLAAAVHEDSYVSHAGEPVVKGRHATKVTLPYRNGMLGGLMHPVFGGNVFQATFGFRDRVPGNGRQMDDPYAWKGEIYDTDYSYVAHATTGGDELVRIWGPDNGRRNGYQTELVPGQGTVPGGKIKIVRDEARKLTIYEMAIPRQELALFDPAKGRCRFGFMLYNSEGVGIGGALNWSDAAGVFDFWRENGSFAPTWSQHTAMQTYFSIR